ncbi:MAG: AAA family ATPase [Bdellovibrionales bacterium]|nr:AAA family ATPase [Bdellovibrionales bacterium]
MNQSAAMTGTIEQFQQLYTSIDRELHQTIVGLNDVIEGALAGLFCGGHVLLEGVPGIGKTLLIKSISNVLGIHYKRIQFTPDLMPSDITGTEVLSEDDSGRRAFQFKAGPIFSNVILADEINRATPKTQAALLEAMAEMQVTVLDKTYKLPQPFFVLATQNPIELEGTYPLPEAQLDRFLLKLWVPAPSPSDLKEVLIRTTGERSSVTRSVFGENASETIQSMRYLVRQVVAPEPLLDILVRLIDLLQPTSNGATELSKKYVRFGPGPRGAQSVLLVAKFFALREGRIHLSVDDLRRASVPALRHRIVLNFQADADGVTTDTVIEDALKR